LIAAGRERGKQLVGQLGLTETPIDFTKLNSVLQDFVSATPDIQGAAVVTPDGLPLASSLATTLDEERLGV
jgi:hypothetical protein